MKIEIRKADRSDLVSLLKLQNGQLPVIDRNIYDKFEDVLAQTNHSVLLAFANGEPVGTLSITLIDGIGSQFPQPVMSGAVIKQGYERSGIGSLLIETAQYIADGFKSENSERHFESNQHNKILI